MFLNNSCPVHQAAFFSFAGELQPVEPDEMREMSPELPTAV